VFTYRGLFFLTAGKLAAETMASYNLAVLNKAGGAVMIISRNA